MESNIVFKKSFFGGFDREDVMNYISAMSDEFFRYKKDTVCKVEEMKKKIEELEKEYNALVDENNALKEKLASEDKEQSQQDNIKELIEGLTESMNVLIGVLSSDDALPDKENEEQLSDIESEAPGETEGNPVFTVTDDSTSDDDVLNESEESYFDEDEEEEILPKSRRFIDSVQSNKTNEDNAPRVSENVTEGESLEAIINRYLSYDN